VNGVWRSERRKMRRCSASKGSEQGGFLTLQTKAMQQYSAASRWERANESTRTTPAHPHRIFWWPNPDTSACQTRYTGRGLGARLPSAEEQGLEYKLQSAGYGRRRQGGMQNTRQTLKMRKNETARQCGASSKSGDARTKTTPAAHLLRREPNRACEDKARNRV
jgi:hypothetical protein